MILSAPLDMPIIFSTIPSQQEYDVTKTDTDRQKNANDLRELVIFRLDHGPVNAFNHLQ